MGRRLEIGNYRYTVRGEKQDSVFGWGYVAIGLDRRLPHLLLDAKANDRSVFGIRTSNLPVDLARDQRLPLGGEFDDKFTLYAPSDYGRDAFLIFAPDLMALFIDRLGNALTNQATQLLGGDVVVSADQPIPPQWIDEAQRRLRLMQRR